MQHRLMMMVATYDDDGHNDDDEYNDDDDGGGDDYDDGGQHSGQQGHAEPASKISSVSSEAACIPTPCFQTHKTAGLSSSFVAIIIIIIISLGCIITPCFLTNTTKSYGAR